MLIAYHRTINLIGVSNVIYGHSRALYLISYFKTLTAFVSQSKGLNAILTQNQFMILSMDVTLLVGRSLSHPKTMQVKKEIKWTSQKRR